MCIVYLDEAFECESGICKGFEESKNNGKGRVGIFDSRCNYGNYTYEGKIMRYVCEWCKSEMANEKYQCKIPGCRVLKHPEDEYCFQHDENFVPPTNYKVELE